MSTASQAPAAVDRGMHPKLWIAGRAVVVAASMVGEKVRPSEPLTRADIPRAAGDITGEWLTDVLCHEHPGARVTDFKVIGGTSQTTSRAAIRVEYNETGCEAGLSTELYAKTTTGLGQRLLVGGAQVIHGETLFYTRFRPRVEMEAPLGYWGGVDDRSWRSMILMEDIATTRGATFIEPTTPLTRAQVEDIVVNLAACHGAWWDDPELGKLKTTRDHLRNVSGFADMGKRCAVGLKKAREVVVPAVRDEAARLWKGTARALEIAATQRPLTLLHGDPHVGQAYVTRDGRMGLTDWQSIMAGGWGFDFGYFVGSACEPDDRRAWERELLELYLTKLGEAGGSPPSFADAWHIYRQSLCYPCTGWSFAYGRAFYQPKMQPDDTCRTVISRLAVAVDDLRTFDALGV
jgi:Phosphotransferase enzyme family